MKTHDLVLSGLFIAAGIILPIIFHMFGGAGNIFLPMHLPVLLAGFFLGKKAGFLVGVITPILSSAFTGMPPILPMLPIMFCELGTYGYLSGYFYKTKEISLLKALILSMVGGRIAATVAVFILVNVIHLQNFHASPVAYFVAMITTGIPGIAVQIIFVPLLMKRLHMVYYKFKTRNKT